ncbi:MAG TPA: RecQ family ATP-dependent DNA helicase, partial [Thermomicrobiales bacterium]|nr:RecQ family ATP-dependent DNA helicase [Thermomicrobiales bacterium]
MTLADDTRTAEAEPVRRLRDLVAADPARVAALSAKAQWELYACLRGLGDLPLAATLLDALAAQHGPLAKVLDAQAQLWPLLGREEEALRAAQERVERFPSPTGDLALARTFLAAGRLEDAAALAERLRDREPARADGWVLLGQVALEQGDAEAALEVFEHLLTLQPDSPVARRGLARAHAALGEDEAAATLLADLVDGLGPTPTIGGLTALAEVADELGDDATAARLREQASAQWVRRAAALVEPLAATPVARERDTTAAPLADLRAADEAEAPAAPEVLAAVQEYFGFGGLRPGQARVIEQALAGVDTLATMPTGAGKSLCYQVCAMLRPGVTVVISPLIALMQDQVESLPPAIAERATLINSTLDPAELRHRQDEIAAGRYRLVYAAPERLRQPPFLRALASAGVSLLVVDEAHCISLWGHDFRPDYLVIPRVLPALGEPCVLAMTATATPEMAREIADRLGRPLARVQVSLFRPNLRYEVRHLPNKEAKYRALVDLCRELEGSGIVYVSSREGCEQVEKLLNKELKRRRWEPDVALAYHAGFEKDDRADRMRRFMDGEVRIMAATVAFGMGVDKADVRFIVHLSPPKSLEAYAQESGRAGRDGRPARCVLLYASADKANLSRWAKQDEFDLETLRRCYAQARRVLGAGWGVVSPADVSPPELLQHDLDVRVGLGILERAGLLERHPDAPRTAEIVWSGATPDGASDRWDRFLAATDLQPGERRTLDLVDLAGHLDRSPAELEQQLLDWREEGAGLRVAAGRRDLCLRLVLPAPPAVAAGLPGLLEEVRRENEKRVARMVVFATSRSCRHAALAAHLGERLPPCRTACDVCLATSDERRTKDEGRSTNDERRATSRGSAARAADAHAPRSTLHAPPSTADAALTALACLGTLPFPMGKSGLTKVLAGSITAAVKGDRSAQFGALEALSQTRIGGLIERLVEDGYIHRDETSEYRLLSLTAPGRAATRDDLAAYDTPTPPAREPAAGARLTTGARLLDGFAPPTTDEDHEWTTDELALLDRLKAWRTEQARERGV